MSPISSSETQLCTTSIGVTYSLGPSRIPSSAWPLVRSVTGNIYYYIPSSSSSSTTTSFSSCNYNLFLLLLLILLLLLHLLQEQIRSKQLEDSIQQTDQLLYQMIPKPIADKLRSGETPLNTCQVSLIVYTTGVQCVLYVFIRCIHLIRFWLKCLHQVYTPDEGTLVETVVLVFAF